MTPLIVGAAALLGAMLGSVAGKWVRRRFLSSDVGQAHRYSLRCRPCRAIVEVVGRQTTWQSFATAFRHAHQKENCRIEEKFR